ncbi:hypothetical protein LTR10_016795 [Elasticomyces elasticus]|uniref:Zn(2)-C6 fungal-type domain-containing protein n=1 Tax=Exophiala sideris TaxID=1016849 RepID=A0ABR0JMS2_9EURO|nr:hypothetical protein LTR10_016795 [Elasticomyces elasticus]KAK5037798.1 hypothetical protein LTS07_001265 [Exophiala sideris]KAK5043781.1 hypothetical protein LTR13_000135 [Exophiala sideris]KAK5067280.1 hypothetical protein LTR69_001267 [Exophiala sideris]KAK5182613.1 hypothetical protein LTR44_005004 [Eurotiomycetes sp. CCFEE 6388]
MDIQSASIPDVDVDDPSEELAAADGRIEMAQEDIDAIIRNKRKVRDPKACYACHRRKVKCDRNLPCDSCVKRDHPELCSYERPTKKRRIALTGAVPQDEGQTQDPALQSGPNVTVPREQWERMNRELQRLRDMIKAESLSPGDHREEMDDPNPAGTRSRSDEAEREGIHAQSNQMGTMHLGSRSVLAYMMALGRSQTTQDTARSLLEENILPKLGLDNESATYPFVDLWSTASSMQDVSGLCKAIPDDELCREFFVAYRDIAGTLYPVIPDAASFEDTLTFMLSNRARAQRDNLELDPNKPYGVSLAWLSLVFAVFASGSQCADRPAKERELTSQVYICCSYQALRMANFLTHPCLETIEASLIIGNVLSYNMNPGVAYIFLGMTLRMAFSIGLQINSNHFTEAEKWTRRRIWWALAWQDSHFAVSYDRPTSSVLCIPDIPYGKYSSPGDRSYAESMFAIIRLTQEIVRERLLRPRSYMTWETIRKYTDEIANIVAQGADHLRDRNKCYRTTQQLERLALKLHSSYIISELCRPALKEPSSSSGEGVNASSLTPSQSPGGRRKSSHPHQSPHSPTLDSAIRAQLRRDCVQALEAVVTVYVELHSISRFAARSWIGIQRAISAAFLLGTLPDTGSDQQRLSLLRELEQVITQRTTEDPTFDLQPQDGPSQRRLSATEPPPLADSPHWVRSMSKSLNALGKLNATLNGSKSAAKYPYLQNSNGQANPSGVFMNMGSNPGQSQAQSNPRSAFPGVANLKQEPFSPALATSGILSGNSGMSGGMGLGPITPDSTGSSDWNFGNLHERAAEFVQAPLWGDAGFGSYLG